MSAWTLMVATLSRAQTSPLPAIAGRVIRAADAPLPDADLAAITCPIELATVLGIARATAIKRLAERVESAHLHGLAAGAAAALAHQHTARGVANEH